MKLFEVVTGIKGETQGLQRELTKHLVASNTIGQAVDRCVPDPAEGAVFTVTYLGELFEPPARSILVDPPLRFEQLEP